MFTPRSDKGEEKSEINSPVATINGDASVNAPADLSPVDQAVAKAAAVFAGYDARHPEEKARVNPHPFAIMTSASADISHLFGNSYLFIKEPGSVWQFYHVKYVEGKIQKVHKDIHEIEGLEALLNSNEFTDDVYKQIKSILALAKEKDNTVKLLEEAIDTEKRFLRGIQEFVRRIEKMYPGLDPVTQRRLDIFMPPYRGFVDIFPGFSAEQSLGLTQDEKIAMYEKLILNAFASPEFSKNNLDAFFAVLPQDENFNTFLNARVPGHESISSWDNQIKTDLFMQLMQQNAQSGLALKMSDEQGQPLGSLRIMPVQRYPRYVLLLDQMEKQLPGSVATKEALKMMQETGKKLNIATSVSKLLLARQAAGTITREIRLLQGLGVDIDPRIFDGMIESLHNKGDIDSVRVRLKTDLLQLYSRVYVEYRYKGYLSTSKEAALKNLEKFILNVENTLELAGVPPVLVAHAADINAHGKNNREEVIFSSAGALPIAELKLIVADLYEQGKVIVAKLVSASDAKQVEKIKENFANIFKVLQKIGPEAKNQWNLHVREQTQENAADFELANVFLIQDKFVQGKLSEDHAKTVFNANTALFKKKFSTNSPVSEAAASESKADDIDVEEEDLSSASDQDAEPVAAPTLHYSRDLILQRGLKREIFGKLAEQIVKAKANAAALGFDQFHILEKFAARVNDKIIPDYAFDSAEELSPALASKVIADSVDASKMAKVFYADFIRAYIDAYMLQGKAKESLLPILRELLVNFDTTMQVLGGEFVLNEKPISIDGILFRDNRKPSEANLDQMVLGSIVPPNATRDDFPRLGEEVINHLFDNVLGFVNARPQTEYEKAAFKNAIAAVMQMGRSAAQVWNARAVKEFYELTIVSLNPEDNALLNSFEAVSALKSTEADRRDAMITLAADCYRDAVKGLTEEQYPSAERAADMKLLLRANRAGVENRNQLRHNLQLAIYEIHKKAYSEGRKRSGIKSVATPYLAAEVEFIKNFDKGLLERGQKPLIVEGARYYKADPIENANLIWNQAEKAFGKHKFPLYIEELFEAVRANFQEMQRGSRRESLLEFGGKQPTGPFVKAEKSLVNTLKAIQRMCNEGDHQVTDKAKKLWNELVQRHQGEFGNFGSLLIVPEAKKISETATKDAFKSIVDLDLKQITTQNKIAAAFHVVLLKFDEMLNYANASHGAVTANLLDAYIKNEKDMSNPFYAARKQLELTLIDVQKQGPFAQEVWNKLSAAQSGRYGEEMGRQLMLEGKVTEDSIKKSFLAMIGHLASIHKTAKGSDKQANIAAFFKKPVSPVAHSSPGLSKEQKKEESQGASVSRSPSPRSLGSEKH